MVQLVAHLRKQVQNSAHTAWRAFSGRLVSRPKLKSMFKQRRQFAARVLFFLSGK